MDDGESIFTPYNSRPENTPWEKCFRVDGGNLKLSKNKLQFTVTIERPISISMARRKAMHSFTDLLIKLGEI